MGTGLPDWLVSSPKGFPMLSMGLCRALTPRVTCSGVIYTFVFIYISGINTFCSELLCGVMLPLLLVAPFTVFIMLPKGLTFTSDREGLKKMMWSELAQGELALFERESLLRYAAFKLASKYILFRAARVSFIGDFIFI